MTSDFTPSFPTRISVTNLAAGFLARSGVKRSATSRLDSAGRDQAELLAQTGKARRDEVAHKEFGRLRLENDHRARQPEFL